MKQIVVIYCNILFYNDLLNRFLNGRGAKALIKFTKSQRFSKLGFQHQRI